MVDVLSPQQRAYCMSRIQGKNTKPEVVLRKALWASGLRYRIKNNLPGKPDIIFPGKMIAVFVDGCFWHRCPKHYQAPKTRAKFWEKKIAGNVARDIRNNKSLDERGWLVVRVWEHEIKNDMESVVNSLITLHNSAE